MLEGRCVYCFFQRGFVINGSFLVMVRQLSRTEQCCAKRCFHSWMRNLVDQGKSVIGQVYDAGSQGTAHCACTAHTIKSDKA